MKPIHLKTLVAILATLVTLAILLVMFLLIRDGKNAEALVSLIGVIAGGGGLFWLFDRLSR